MRKSSRILLIGLMIHLQVGLLSSFCYGQTLLEYSAEHFFNPATAPRVGIEIELTGLTIIEIGETLKNHLGGQLVPVDHLEDYIDSKTGLQEKYSVREWHLINSKMNTVVIKPEDNGTENSSLAENTARTRIFEIVTPPIYFDQLPDLQNAMDEMKLKGALGTLDGHAVSIQVNVEMGLGIKKNISAENILAILRNYLKPNHRSLIAAELQVPDSRKAYIGDFTPQMTQRILDVTYQPTNSEFFFDFMYRQSLELLSHPEAWTLSKAKARTQLRALLSQTTFEALLPVMKWNFIRTSAVLMYLYPNDWLSEYLVQSTWFHKYPILEFRESNNDFQVLSRVKQFLGLVQKSNDSGDFDFPKILAATKSQKRMCVDLFLK